MTTVITLNVGGTRFEVEKDTLTKSPYFSRMFDGSMKSGTETKDGSIFIDRSPKSFGFILDNLRYGIVPECKDTDWHDWRILTIDFDYFGLEPLQCVNCAERKRARVVDDLRPKWYEDFLREVKKGAGTSERIKIEVSDYQFEHLINNKVDRGIAENWLKSDMIKYEEKINRSLDPNSIINSIDTIIKQAGEQGLKLKGFYDKRRTLPELRHTLYMLSKFVGKEDQRYLYHPKIPSIFTLNITPGLMMVQCDIRRYQSLKCCDCKHCKEAFE